MGGLWDGRARGRAWFAGALLGAALAASGVSGAAAETAFIGKLPDLASAPDKRFDEFYVKAGADLGAFESLHIAPVTLLPGRNEELEKLVPADTRLLVEDLQEQLADKLSGLYPIVDEAGKGVLVLEVAITGLTANQPEGTTTYRKSGRRTIVQIGGASMQGVLKDGGSGEVLVAFVDDYEGFPLDQNLNLISIWGDAYDAFRDWAQGLARKLAELKGGSG